MIYTDKVPLQVERGQRRDTQPGRGTLISAKATMPSVRQRKLLNENNLSKSNAIPHTKSSFKFGRAMDKCHKKTFFCLLAFGLLSTFLIGYYSSFLTMKFSPTNILDEVGYMLNMYKLVHAVIIDAGSTGSRVLAFTFHQPSYSEKMLKLKGELFYEIKPGLSSFANNPAEGAAHLQILLDKAKSVIPHEEWGKTPLVLKATAGLRLLPKEKAEALLQEVHKLFTNSPFYTNVNSVGIMDGVDEGLFSWFTVNYLQNRLWDVSQTTAALDLGGGSTQVTFAPSSGETLREMNPEYLHHMSAFHQNFSVYTHSYLGLGLMAARQGILTVGNPPDATELHSECINALIHTEWSYGGKTYKIMGPENPKYITRDLEKRPVVRYAECSKIIKNYIANKVDKPKELNSKEINAFSYYFDRATESGLIDPFEGGVVTVETLNKTTGEVCSTANVEQPFMCLDLLYIVILLQDGFGLDSNTQLNLFKKINNHEISWALGAAFNVLVNGL